ncbi:hypothetical protein SO802_011464 [Lithocarpus litseifolius]|uniref:Wall-associated receptor kinase C-terminal domain-containing protein n=1 Tax=Lithocarpus litseifolius TaxID=425828 RepID=A0AAW2D025_9ROSI
MECKASVLAPVEAYGGGIGIGESLRNGFVLKWKASNCSICEDSGGNCGFDNIMYQFKCFCPDSRGAHGLWTPTPNADVALKRCVQTLLKVTFGHNVSKQIVVFTPFAGERVKDKTAPTPTALLSNPILSIQFFSETFLPQ